MAGLKCSEIRKDYECSKVAITSELKDCLPGGYEYHVCSYKRLVTGGYDARLRLRLHTKDGVMEWLSKYQESTKVTLRVDHKRKETNKTVFNTSYRCQHRTLSRSETANKRLCSKNTNCPARLAIKIKSTAVPKRIRTKFVDAHLPHFPTIVDIGFVHNHSLCTADALKFRDVLPSVAAVFEELFEKGHSPASALNAYRADLQAEHGCKYAVVAADRAICPDIQYLQRLYRKKFNRGADPVLLTNGRQRAADLTSSRAVVQHRAVSAKCDGVNSPPVLTDVGKPMSIATDAVLDSRAASSAAGFVPNYLRHPSFPYTDDAISRADAAVRVEAGARTAPAKTAEASSRSTPLSGQPLSSRDVVLKVRIADATEKDFIEVDVAPAASFESLKRKLCEELGVTEQVSGFVKVRKLPNTIVRNDRDVARLGDYQELELVFHR